MNHSAQNPAILARSFHSDPFRNMECAREAFFDMLHDIKPAPVTPPAPVAPKRAGWLSMLLSKLGA